MEFSLSLTGAAGLYLILGFTISILLWVLKFYAYTIFSARDVVERRLKGELMDYLTVLFIALIFTTSLSFLSQLGIPGLSYSSGSLQVPIDKVLLDLDGLARKIEGLMETQVSTIEGFQGILAGFSVNIMGLPVYVGAENRIGEEVYTAQAFYFLLLRLYVVVKTTFYFFQYLAAYTPLLIMWGAVLRGYPGLKTFGGFLMALGLAFLIYPITFVLFFNPPAIPEIGGAPTPTFCGLKGMSPITLSVGGTGGALFYSSLLPTTMVEIVRELFVVFVLRHIISLGVSLLVLRTATIVLASQVVLTGLFENRLGV